MNIGISIKSIASGIRTATTAIVWLVATSKFWINSDSSSSSYWIVRYFSDRFWPELCLVAVVVSVVLLPRPAQIWISRRIERRVARAVSDIKSAISGEVSSPAILRLISLTVLFYGIWQLVSIGLPFYGQLIHDRGALLIKYREADMLRFLDEKAEYEIETLHYMRARSIYLAAIDIFGENERTSSIERELAKLDRFKEFGAATFSRAEELEKSIGFNRTSMYLYSSILAIIPDSLGPYDRLSAYSLLLNELHVKNDFYEASCNSSLPSLSPLTREEYQRLGGFLASSPIRSLLAPENSMPALERAKSVCLHLKAFGPAFHSMSSEREHLSQQLASFKEGRIRPVSEDEMADFHEAN